jgi:hypothetical protein
MYHVSFALSEKQAHKLIARHERNERIWNWMDNNNGKLAIILAAIVFISLVFLAS